jgi:hypothetical protein
MLVACKDPIIATLIWLMFASVTVSYIQGSSWRRVNWLVLVTLSQVPINEG